MTSVILALIGPCRRSAGQGVHDAADQLRADRHFQDAPVRLTVSPSGDVLVGTQNHGADGVALEVQSQPKVCVPSAAGGKFQHFALHHRTGRGRGRYRRSNGHDGALVADVHCAATKTLDAALISSEISAGLSCMLVSQLAVPSPRVKLGQTKGKVRTWRPGLVRRSGRLSCAPGGP